MKPSWAPMHRALALSCAFLFTVTSPATAGPNAAEARGTEAAAVGKSATATPPFREIKWEDLIPKGWDPTKQFRNRNLASRSDADPRAQMLFQEMREVWDNAPTVDSLEGATVKLPGYVVPLEETRGELKEFLLVPYFGACIHTPPPPANQIVFIVSPKGAKFHTMETVWVSGTLHTSRQASYMGSSGYRIDAASVERYSTP